MRGAGGDYHPRWSAVPPVWQDSEKANCCCWLLALSPGVMGEDINQEQRAELHALLQSRLVELEGVLHSSVESAAIVDLSAPIGRLTRMDAMQQQKMAVATRTAFKQEKSLVERALRDLEGGDYGLCRECEEPIGYRRLLARPAAPFCLACQRANER